MKFYKFVLLKTYFDKGYSLLNYLKYLIALVGISSLDIKLTLMLGVMFALLSFIVGYIWIEYNFLDAETEVINQHNPFIKDMGKRRKLK